MIPSGREWVSIDAVGATSWTIAITDGVQRT